MMNYFAIEFSLNEKIMGKIEQVKEYRHNCDVWNEPNFIDRFPFEKIEIEPILSNLVLYSTSKLTDFIRSGGIGFSGSMVISNKFKNILDNFNCFGVQFFPTHLIHKNKEIDNYWQSHIYDIPYDYIDFKKTKIFIKNSENGNVNFDEPLIFKSLNEFKSKLNSLEYPFSILIKELNFNDKMNYDYFFLRFFDNGGSLGVVSKRLKTEIENQGCTGIEFRPIELSLREWYDSSEREKIYGKSY
jgi:hypothetical protein